jgi:hypothetical protein
MNSNWTRELAQTTWNETGQMTINMIARKPSSPRSEQMEIEMASTLPVHRSGSERGRRGEDSRRKEKEGTAC